MPLIGLEIKGKQYSFQEALKDPLNITGLPAMILIGIIKSTQYRGKSISATTLTGCRRKTYFERTYDYFADPKGLIYKAFRGTIIHQILEVIADGGGTFTGEYGIQTELVIDSILKEYIQEKRFSRTIDINGITVELSGKIDLYHAPTSTLNDYKTCEPYPVVKIGKCGLDPDHQFQLNFYKWVMEPYLPVKKIMLHYIGYGFIATTGMSVNVRNGFRPVTVELPEVEIWDEDEFLYIALPRIEEMHKAFTEDIVPSCDPGENNYRCKNCSFTDKCKSTL